MESTNIEDPLPKPNKLIRSTVDNRVTSGKALDIGIGGGRDALYLASLGYDVDAVDINEAFSLQCNQIAVRNQLKVHSRHLPVVGLDFPEHHFDVITSSWVFQTLSARDFTRLSRRLIRALKENGILVLSVFSTRDPRFQRIKGWNAALLGSENHSASEPVPRYYFSRGEIIRSFKQLKLLSLNDKIAIDLGHGKPHYHGIIEYVGQKNTIIPVYP